MFAPRFLTAIGALAVAACTGDVRPSVPETGGSGGQPSSSYPTAGGGGPGASESPISLGGVRRLTTAQYANTVHDLLGDVAIPSTLEPDDRSSVFASVGGYSTTLSADGVERYADAAFAIARAAFSQEASRQKLTGCTAPDDACVGKFIPSFGLRAYRRPLTDVEAARYRKLATAVTTAWAGDRWRGLEAVTAAMIQSPNFLYVPALGTSGAAGPLALDGYEVASRVSYALWNTTPDGDLWVAAQRGDLRDAAGVRKQIDRLLASPRARDAIAAFVDEALGVIALPTLKKDAAAFPSFDAKLAAAMASEIHALVDDVVVQRRADVRELLSRPYAFVNAPLASLYGLQGASGDDLRKIDLPSESPRGGLLSTAAVSSVYAHTTKSSATLRGVFVRERVLCQTVPPPPKDAKLEFTGEAATAPTARQRLAAHRENPSCAACHAFFDPIGLTLEPFDGIGRQRTSENGVAIDASGELDGNGFRGPKELAALLAKDDRVSACFARHLFRYAIGRDPSDAALARLEELQRASAATGLLGLARELMASELFRFVTPGS